MSLKAETVLPGNRLKVDAYNRVESHSNIFAIGDIAAIITEKTPNGHPMLAPVAIGQARVLAQNLRRVMDNQPLKLFHYRDLGMLVGFRNRVVAIVNWAWNYFSYDRGLRLIIRPFKDEKFS